MQHGMLFDTLSAQEPGVDVEQIVIRCREELDTDALQESWERVVTLHPVLRTSFRWEGIREPLQDVHEQVTLSWDLQDWRDLTSGEQDARIKAYLRADRRQGFHMNEQPLMRFALFRLGDAVYQFLWTFHHALLDGRSFLIVLKDAYGIYAAACQGREALIRRPRP